MALSSGMKRSYFAFCVCAIAIITTGVKPVLGQVDVQTQNITVLEGDKAEILCRYGTPILYCRIQIPGERVLNLSPDWDKSPGFQYFGQGLTTGQCGVTIAHVKPNNHGPVQCFLGVAGEEVMGSAYLTVAQAPTQPELNVQGSNKHGNVYEIEEKIIATCTSRDGRPPATITWFLDDEPITDGLSLVETVDSQTTDNLTLFMVTQVLTKYIKATDDRKTLICRTSHIAGQPQDARHQIQVRYKPQPLPITKVFGVRLGTTALINVTINASPRPTTEWRIVDLKLMQGEQKERYAAYEPVDLGSGVFNVTLSIAGLTLEDTVKEYILRASNEFGVQDYSVRISSSEAAVETGLDIGSIIGIVIGVAVLLIIIALVVVARVTGKWCFSGKQQQSTLPQPNETSDTESADIKQSKTKKFNLNFDGFFKKKTPKTDVEQNADDGNDDAAPSEATVIIEDDPPKPSNKDLVYAELMLKPSDSESPNKESTEYAEIVYVTPPAGAQDAKKAQSKKK